MAEAPRPRGLSGALRWLFSAPDPARLRGGARILGSRLWGLARDLAHYGLIALGVILPVVMYLDHLTRRGPPKNQYPMWASLDEIQGHMLAGRPLYLNIENPCATPAEALALAKAWRERPQAIPEGACRPASPRWNEDLSQAELRWPCGDRCADAVAEGRAALAQDWDAGRPMVAMKGGRVVLEDARDKPAPQPRDCDRPQRRPGPFLSTRDFAEAATIRMAGGELVISISPAVARWMRDRRRAERQLACLQESSDED